MAKKKSKKQQQAEAAAEGEQAARDIAEADNAKGSKKKRGKKTAEAADPAAEAPPAVEAGELSPQEEAALGADNAAAAEAADQVVDAAPPAEGEAANDADDEPFVERDGQVALFPSDSKIAAKEVDITESYKAVTQRLTVIKEHAAFFKSFSGYMAQLDPGPEGDVCQENLKAALVRCEKMSKDLNFTLSTLRKIDEFEQQLSDMVNARSGQKAREPLPRVVMLPNEKQALGKLGKQLREHVPALQDDDDDGEEATLENFERHSRAAEHPGMTDHQPVYTSGGEQIGETVDLGAAAEGSAGDLGTDDDRDDSAERFTDDVDAAERAESGVNGHE